MNVFIKDFLPLIIAPLLGWATNWIAVRMLFRPQQPPKFKMLSWLQGVVPSRRDVIAEKIGQTIEQRLITREDMHLIIRQIDIKSEIEGTIDDILDRELEKMVIPIPTRWNLAIKRKLMKRIEDDVTRVTEQTIPAMLEKIDIKEIVKNRISQFSNTELERIVTTVADRELKHIVWLGGVIGLIVGIIQTLINVFL